MYDLHEIFLFLNLYLNFLIKHFSYLLKYFSHDIILLNMIRTYEIFDYFDSIDVI